MSKLSKFSINAMEPTKFLKGSWSIFLYNGAQPIATLDKEDFEKWLLGTDHLKMPMNFFDGTERIQTYSTATVKEFWQSFHPAKQLRIINAFYLTLTKAAK